LRKKVNNKHLKLRVKLNYGGNTLLVKSVQRRGETLGGAEISRLIMRWGGKKETVFGVGTQKFEGLICT